MLSWYNGDSQVFPWNCVEKVKNSDIFLFDFYLIFLLELPNTALHVYSFKCNFACNGNMLCVCLCVFVHIHIFL